MLISDFSKRLTNVDGAATLRRYSSTRGNMKRVLIFILLIGIDAPAYADVLTCAKSEIINVTGDDGTKGRTLSVECGDKKLSRRLNNDEETEISPKECIPINSIEATCDDHRDYFYIIRRKTFEELKLEQKTYDAPPKLKIIYQCANHADLLIQGSSESSNAFKDRKSEAFKSCREHAY
jgi:hypothetical protein